MTGSGVRGPGGFRRLGGGEAPTPVRVDGTDVVADACDSVAAALLMAGKRASQANKASGEPRGPYCMMGVCFECLVTIDGVPDQQGCMILVRAGMRIETQVTARGEASS